MAVRSLAVWKRLVTSAPQQSCWVAQRFPALIRGYAKHVDGSVYGPTNPAWADRCAPVNWSRGVMAAPVRLPFHRSTPPATSTAGSADPGHAA